MEGLLQTSVVATDIDYQAMHKKEHENMDSRQYIEEDESKALHPL